MYRQDCALLFGMTAMFWAFLLFMINQVNSLAFNNAVRIVVLTAGIALGGCAALGVLSVLVHATNNRTQIYGDDIEWANKGKNG